MANNTWGISETGFYCPTYDEILNENIKSAKGFFGEDIITDSASPFGKFIRLLAQKDRRLFEMAEAVYYSFSPATATGISLDRAVSFARITRNTAVAAVYLIRVYGTKNYTIPVGTMFRSKAGVRFYSVSEAVIDQEYVTEELGALYFALVKVQCVDAGTIGNTNNIIGTVKVNNNITSVSYYKTVTEGADTEADMELHKRFTDIMEGQGSNTADSIIASVLKINGVHDCIIKFNNTDEDMLITENLTIEKDTYGVIVYAGESHAESIAGAIFAKMPKGVRQSGIEVVTVEDEAGEYHNVRFSFVTEKKVDISIRCTVNSTFGSSGLENIRSNVENYINNLGIGEELRYQKLYKYIFDVNGLEDVELLTVAGGKVNVEASDMEIIRCGSITITTTEV